jgi:two-component system, LuxR family, sensor kinase FixL
LSRPAARTRPTDEDRGDVEQRLDDELAALREELDRLRESEEMYRASARLSGRLVWSAGADGRLLAISPIFETLTGADSGEGWLGVAHPDDRELARTRWEHSVRTGEPYSVEFRSRMADASYRMVLSKAVPVRDETGRILRWYGSTQDVEEEYQAQRARREAIARLRESEELHRFTVELTQQIVWSVEPDGSGLTLSERYHDMTGVAPGGDASLSIHPDERERVVAAWTRSLETGRPYVDECRLRMKDGSYRYFRLRAEPLRAEDGTIVRWYGMTVDVHEEQLAELARREVEERYRLAVQATNDAVWDHDLVADTIDWSENSAEIFAMDAPIGRTDGAWWKDRIHPDDSAAVDESRQRAIADGSKRWSASYRFRLGNGKHADVLDRGFIIRDAAGNPLRAVGAMADLTERNRAEAEIRRMQSELIHVSRLSAMGAMASTLAHELNQPLAAVSNFISGARRLAVKAADAPVALHTALESAGEGAQRAGEIVRRVRELVTRGTVTVQAETVALLVEEASVLGFVDAKLLGIEHRIELDPSGPWVLCDRIQIQQVLINLIRNAIEAIARADTREILISSRLAGDRIEICVADTGPGIAPEHLDTLFSQFMTTKSGGMGIGLPISRTIVEAHGGQIWAENRPEGGAMFRFTLPKARPPRQRKR